MVPYSWFYDSDGYGEYYNNWWNGQLPGKTTTTTTIANGGTAIISSGDDGNAGKRLSISNGSTVRLTGGSLSAVDEYVGDSGSGTFTQENGTHTVGGTLTIGHSGGEGTYHLSGDESLLTATEEYIGLSGVGTFVQEDGTHRVSDTLTIGTEGRYELYDGTLSTPNLWNDGAFGQLGGELSSTVFENNSGGRYEYSRGTFSGSLVNNGTAVFNPSELAVFDANISGNGELRKLGEATLVLTGTNPFSGDTFVSSGVLQGDTRSLQGGIIDIAENATVVFDQAQTGTYAGTLSGAGKLTKDGAGTLILIGTNSYEGGTLVSSGVLQGNTTSLHGNITNNARVVFDQAETDTFRGTIGGAGNVVKQNAGLLVFNEQNTYSGGTQILGGNLQVGDASHPDASILGLVGVGPNGILSGHGTINGSVDNAGTIAPGGSIGTLTVTGDVAFQSGSTFQVDINPTESDRLDVGGTGSLGGAQVDVVAADGAYGPTRYRILSAGSIDGRFRDEVTSNLATIDPLLTPSLAYDARNVYLDLDLVQLQDPMGPPTQVATDLVYMIDRMTTGRFNQALGELCPTSLGVWARGFGMVSSASATGDIPGYDGDTSGFVLGMDGQPTERLSLGIVGFSANVDVTTNTNFTDRSTVNLFGFNLYGAYTHGAWQVRSALGYSNESYRSRQTIGGGAQRRRAGGSTEANRISNYTEGSYTFKSHNLSVQPMLAVQFGWMDQDGFTQQGLFADGQSLNVRGRTQKVFDTLLGAREA